MAQTTMNVKLIAHTKVPEEFAKHVAQLDNDAYHCAFSTASDGQIVSLTAIRTCYSPLKPSSIVAAEGEKYFASGGTEADRLFRHIVKSGHTSTLEHLTYTFAIEGVSRSLLAQLTRHRIGFSFSVQSQRYVKFGSDDKSGGFDYVVPESVNNASRKTDFDMSSGVGMEVRAHRIFDDAMEYLQRVYDALREAGIPAEDARAVLPNAAATNLVMTANLRALLEFYSKRRKGSGAQAEIAELSERLRETVVAVEPWVDKFFEGTD